MSFLSTQISVPLWLLLIIIAGLIPLFFQLLSWLKSRGILDKADIVIDARMTTIIPIKKQTETSKKSKHPHAAKVLKLLVRKGDQGMLLQSIADTLGVDSSTANTALRYLETKKLIEIIEGMGGDKFFLTQVGKNYCAMKGYKL